MKRGYLSEYFVGAGTKILTRVDATTKSNQHEIGDAQKGKALKKLLGDQERRIKQGTGFRTKYIWFLDEQESISEDGLLSWYDTRKKKDHRDPEWRLYYQSNPVTDIMSEGDRLVVARRHDDTLLFIVVPDESTIGNKLLWLFGLEEAPLINSYAVQTITEAEDTKLDFVARFILDEIGVEYEDPNANSLDSIIERFGTIFPTTAKFSDLARLTLPAIDARDDPDAALLAWLDHEEAMFRRLEARIVEKDIRTGWTNGGKIDVDAFIKYSLGVQNRRKSRMGRSFENHLRAVFDQCEIRYDAQVITEKGKKPDFIFPGAREYADPAFCVSLLTMLAAKSTCKDRWPQILPEAERIPDKHLVTLEPGISIPQTTMMKESGVQLIVPGHIRDSYTDQQRDWLWSLQDFVTLVSKRQETL